MQEVEEKARDRLKSLAEANVRAAEMVARIQELNEEIRTEKEKAETYLDLVDVIIVALDRKGRITLLNKRGHEVLGYPEGDLLGKDWFETCIPSRMRKEAVSVFKKLISGKTETMKRVENPIVTRLQQERTISWNSKVIRGPNGKIEGTLSAGEDITERKCAEEALRESEQKYRTIFDFSPEAIVLLDAKGQILDVNRRVYDWLGYHPEELIGTNLVNLPFMTRKSKLIVANKFFQRMLGRTVPPYELEFKSERGDREIGEITGNPIRDAHGKIVGDLAVISDVSERKRSEELQSALYRVAEISGSADGLEEFYNALHWIVAELIHAKNFYVALYDPEDAMVHFPYFVDQKDPAPDPRPIGKGLTDYVIRTGEPLLASSSIYEEMRGEIESIGSPALNWLGVPLKVNERTCGVIAVQSYVEEKKFGEKEKELLAFVSTHIATALERKRGQQALRESEEKYRTIVENTEDVIMLTRPDGIISYLSPSCERVLGYSQSDLTGKQPWIAHPDDIDRVKKMHNEALKGKPGSNYEYRIVTKNGEVKWVSHSWSPIRVRNEIHMLVSLVRDVTLRKRAEDALQYRAESEKLINSISKDFINVSPEEIDDGMIRVLRRIGEFVGSDRSYIVLFSDDGRTMRKTHEWCAEDIEPQIERFNDLELHELPWWMDKLKRLELIHIPSVAEMPEETAAEQRILGLQDIQSLIVLPMVHSGALIGFFGFDSVRRRRDWRGKEMSLLMLVGELLSNAVARKKTEEELIKARETALQASRVKSRFLANMSHEIRTPMNAIIGMADLLWDTPLTSEQKQYVKVFKSAGDDLLDLINAVLDISKIEAGQVELERIDFDLNDLLDKVTEIMGLKAAEQGIELSCHIEPGVPLQLIGDPIRLRQVIVNLVGNALKFTKEGEIRINVQNEQQSRRPGMLLFSVADTGIGIPSEKLDTIFDSFTQADSSHTREYGGTGLGLAISKRLVTLMEGRIWAESTPGRGSIFSFTCTLGIQPQPESQTTLPVDLMGMKTLVVDDNATNRLILKETLTSWGAVVTELETGTDAVAELKRARDAGQSYTLALLDSRMPGMAGFEVAEQIKKDPALTRITMMMLTSDRRKGDLARCQQLGIASYLIKPIKRRDLSEAIKSIITTGPHDARSETSSAMEGNRCTRFKILLADDSEDNRFLIQAYLKKTAYNIDTAENGVVACESFTRDHYDLVLMDMQMPVMDGYAATKQMREWEKKTGTTPIPIIALTAYALKEEVQKSLDAGCDAHLSKPIKKSVLLETLESYLTSRSR